MNGNTWRGDSPNRSLTLRSPLALAVDGEEEVVGGIAAGGTDSGPPPSRRAVVVVEPEQQRQPCNGMGLQWVMYINN